MSNHNLDNMIYNLENRKEFNNVVFTKKAVIEILDYLKELQRKEQRIVELQKENKELKQQIIRFTEITLSEWKNCPYWIADEMEEKLKELKEETELKLKELNN